MIWRWRVHRDRQPMHIMAQENSWTALCGLRLKNVRTAASINPELHEVSHPRCAECVAKLDEVQPAVDLDEVSGG